MARTALAVQEIVRSGIVPTFGAANVDGHSVPNSGKEYIYVKNGGGSSINVTIQTPGTVDGQAVADRVVAVANGAEKMIGPFPPGSYSQPDGSTYIDFSAVTSVTIGAFRNSSS
jgi:hypothetical protein